MNVSFLLGLVAYCFLVVKTMLNLDNVAYCPLAASCLPHVTVGVTKYVDDPLVYQKLSSITYCLSIEIISSLFESFYLNFPHSYPLGIQSKYRKVKMRSHYSKRSEERLHITVIFNVVFNVILVIL